MTKVSIVIPVYNVEKYLPDCLDSVLGQTLQEIEVICIDDASPDGSPAILDDYAEKDHRLQVIHLAENHMQGYGRNRGLERASGKYVYFLDSDDMIVPTAMEELYEQAETEQLDGIIFDSQVLYEREELAKRHASYPAIRTGNYEDKVITGQELFDAFCRQNEWNVYVQRQFWNRTYLQANGICFPEGIEHEDELFSFEALLLAKRARYMRKAWFIRRYRDNSVMTREAKPKDFHGYFINYCRMIRLVTEKGIHCFASDDCIAHMYECMQLFYPVFLNQEDPDRWFDGAEEKENYLFYKYLLQSELITKEKSKSFWERLRNYSSIRIYGAGKVAQSVFIRLNKEGFFVESFIVTSKDGNPQRVHGMPVYGIDEVKPEDGGIILVAMSKGYHAEVAKLLEKKHFKYYLYAQNHMEGPFGGDAR